jgi:hypothetical protein
MRGPTELIGSHYNLFSWADQAITGTVDINDLAKAAVDFCKNPAAFPGPGCPADAYFGNPLLGTPGQVNINDIATIATYFDVSLTSPIAPAQLLNLDPEINYFTFGGDTFLGCSVIITALRCWTLSLPTTTGTLVIQGCTVTQTRITTIVDPYTGRTLVQHDTSSCTILTGTDYVPTYAGRPFHEHT